jgi:hypothetical protein
VRGKDILLLHDIHPATVASFARSVEGIKAQGVFVSGRECQPWSIATAREGLFRWLPPFVVGRAQAERADAGREFIRGTNGLYVD